MNTSPLTRTPPPYLLALLALTICFMLPAFAGAITRDSSDGVQGNAALAGVSLAASPLAPQLVNTPITLTATPTGGGSNEYKFRAGYQDAAGWHWSDVTGYQSITTCRWTPVEAHLYTLVVYARAIGSSAAYQVTGTMSYRIVAPLSAVSLATTPAAPQASGTAITLTATATDGLTVEYKFRAGYQDAAGWQWVDLRNYSTARTCPWTPSAAQLYTLLVYAREVGSTKSYDKLATLSYRITTPAPTSVSLSATPAAPRVINTPITLTASAIGAPSVEYQFRSGYQDAAGWHWSVLQNYSASTSCPWTPIVPHNYTLAVWARAQGSTAAYQATATLVYAITATTPLTGVSLLASPASPQLQATPITLTATPTGGANVEYQFRAGYQDAVGWHWSDLQGYNTTRTCLWTPTEARSFTLLVYAREVGNTSAYQVYGTLPFRTTPVATSTEKIAFVSNNGGSTYQIFLMDATGSNKTPVTTNLPSTFPFRLSLSPQLADGHRWVAYEATTNNVNYTISAVRDDGAATRQITTAGADDDFNPSWSPDGSKIALMRLDQAGAASLCYVDVSNLSQPGACIQVAETANGGTPCWMSNAILAYTSCEDGFYNIYSVNFNGTGKSQLSFFSADANATIDSLSWNHNKFVLTGSSPTARSQIFVVADNGVTSIGAALTNGFDDAGACWNVAGDKIIFFSNRPNANGSFYSIFSMNANGTNIVRLTTVGDSGNPAVRARGYE